MGTDLASLALSAELTQNTASQALPLSLLKSAGFGWRMIICIFNKSLSNYDVQPDLGILNMKV